jgi:prevent-host-death family protein
LDFARLAELLRQVKAGKSFTITNRGETIADMVPSAGAMTKDRAAKKAGVKRFG